MRVRRTAIILNKKLLTYSSYLYLLSYAFTITSIGPANAPVSEEFGITERTMGLLISSHFAGFIISVFAAGHIIDRTRIKPIMVASVAFQGCALIAFGASPNLAILFAAMFMTGIGGGAVEAAVNALIGGMYRDTRVYSLNLLHVCFGCGAFTWPMLAGYMLQGGTSWRVIFYIIGAYSLIMTALLAVQRFPAIESEKSSAPVSAAAMLKNRTVVLLGLLIAFYVGGEMGINAWIVRYFDEIISGGDGFSAAINLNLLITSVNFTLNASFFLTLYWFTMTVGRIFATIGGRFLTDITLLRIMTAGSAVAGVATFLMDDVLAAGVMLGITGFFLSGIFATTIATGGNRFPEQLGVISGIVIGFSGLGNVVLNAAIGGIAMEYGLRAGMTFISALLVAMAACSFLISEKSKA